MLVAFLDSVHPILKERLQDAGMVCKDHFKLSRQEILDGALNTHKGLVIRSRITLDAELFDALPNLKWIARSGSGLDNIDLDIARDRGVEVVNSPEGNMDAVGEHTLGMLLSILHKINKGNRSVHNREWLREEHRGEEIGAKTVGIIGYGVMGSSFAKKLSGLGCRVIAFDKYKEGFASDHVEEVSEEQFFAESDIVSVHVPWTSETRGMVNDEWFSRFKKPIIFMNTSRGAVVNTNALLSALNSGIVRSAALDVIEFEGRSLEGLELSEERARLLEKLLSHPEVLMTPHVAGWTVESYKNLSSILADKVLLKFSGT